MREHRAGGENTQPSAQVASELLVVAEVWPLAQVQAVADPTESCQPDLAKDRLVVAKHAGSVPCTLPTPKSDLCMLWTAVMSSGAVDAEWHQSKTNRAAGTPIGTKPMRLSQNGGLELRNSDRSRDGPHVELWAGCHRAHWGRPPGLFPVPGTGTGSRAAVLAAPARDRSAGARGERGRAGGICAVECEYGQAPPPRGRSPG